MCDRSVVLIRELEVKLRLVDNRYKKATADSALIHARCSLGYMGNDSEFSMLTALMPDNDW